MGKLVDKKPTSSEKEKPLHEMTNEERQARARRLHPELFIVPTPEEYEARLKLAKSVIGILTDEEAEAARASIKEGREAPGWE